MEISSKYISPLLAIILSITLAACAQPIPSKNLIPEFNESEQAITSGPFFQSIAVNNVGGGSETNPMIQSEIGDDALKEAITSSLMINNFLSLSAENNRYSLDVFLVEIDKPVAGFTLTVTAFVKYKIVDTRDNKIILDTIIDATDTKTLSDEFVGYKRLQIAQEEAMKKNINKFLMMLVKINEDIGNQFI